MKTMSAGFGSAAVATAILLREGAAELFQRKYERLCDLLDFPGLPIGEELREVYQLRGELYDQGVVVDMDGKIPGQIQVDGTSVSAIVTGSRLCLVHAEGRFSSGS